MNVATLFETAKRISNYAKDATGGGLFTDTTHYRVTVPAGKRWFFIMGYHNRDVSSTTVQAIYNSADDMILWLNADSAGTGIARMLNYNQFMMGLPIVLEAGDYFEITFGTAQGASCEVSYHVLEVSV